MKIPDKSIQMQFRSVRRRFVGRYRRAVGPIEVTAVLNVVVLVGLFVLASSRFVLRPGVQVTLPEAAFTDGAPLDARVLTLAQGGLMFFDDERMTLATLGPALAQVGREVSSAPLLIEADEGTPYGTLMAVVELATEAGLRNVMLATRPPMVIP